MWVAAGQDDDLGFWIVGSEVEGAVQIVGHLQVLGVARLRAVHRHAQHGLCRAVQQQGVESR